MQADDDVGRNGIRQGLTLMIGLESGVQEILARLSTAANGYLEAPAITTRLHSLVTGQREALEAHLQSLGAADIPPIGPSITVAFEPAPEPRGGEHEWATLAVLRAVATAFTDAALGYAVLHALAHRAFDVATADLADQHRRSYLRALRAIHQAAGDVAVRDLEDAGHTCRCQCPACGPGVCICWHVHDEAGATDPEMPTDGIVVRTPRAESNAERAGLQPGDVIVEVNGRRVGTYEDMRDGMAAHEVGEAVTLRVRRGAGDPQEVVITR